MLSEGSGRFHMRMGVRGGRPSGTAVPLGRRLSDGQGRNVLMVGGVGMGGPPSLRGCGALETLLDTSYIL